MVFQAPLPGRPPAFVLLHSPLVGPLTWGSVADELRRRGIEAIVPALREGEDAGPPYWRRHAEAVERALAALPADRPPILAAHSGAGPLLPAAREAIGRPVAAYLFVDAGLPRDGASRLDLFGVPEEVARFRAAAREGLLPTWGDEDLREVIPDAALRRRFVAELRPLPLAVYEEPLPVFAGWPDAPCGYLRFAATPVYEEPEREARRRGWACAQLPGRHFHMLVDPPAVAQALLDLLERADVASVG